MSYLLDCSHLYYPVHWQAITCGLDSVDAFVFRVDLRILEQELIKVRGELHHGAQESLRNVRNHLSIKIFTVGITFCLKIQ